MSQIQRHMTIEPSTADRLRIASRIVSLINMTQVNEVSEQVKTILTSAAIVADIDFRLTLDVLMVDIVVMLFIVHHLLQIMVVGHAEFNRLGVSLAKTGLSIVGNPIVVLIPI